VNLFKYHHNPKVLEGYDVPYTLIVKTRDLEPIDGQRMVHLNIERYFLINGVRHRTDGPAVVGSNYVGRKLMEIYAEWWVSGKRYAIGYTPTGDPKRAFSMVDMDSRFSNWSMTFTCVKPKRGDPLSNWNIKPLTWRTPK
jgi:hypothetical protein